VLLPLDLGLARHAWADLSTRIWDCGRLSGLPLRL